MAGASSAVTTKRELGKATRDAFGRALEALGSEHPDVVVVDADVGNSTGPSGSARSFPTGSSTSGSPKATWSASRPGWLRRERPA